MNAVKVNPKLTKSPIPVVHTRTVAAPSPSGGNYRRPSGESKSEVGEDVRGIPGTLLLIKPKDRFHVEEGFGVSAPMPRRPSPPPLLAHNAQFVKPYEPPPPEMLDASTDTESQVLFKRDLDGLKAYQDWISKTVDPIVRDLRMAIVQAKPDDINEFLYAYSLSLISNGEIEPPGTVDRDDYNREQRSNACPRKHTRK